MHECFYWWKHRFPFVAFDTSTQTEGVVSERNYDFCLLLYIIIILTGCVCQSVCMQVTDECVKYNHMLTNPALQAGHQEKPQCRVLPALVMRES